MAARPPELQAFLDAFRDAIRAKAAPGSPEAGACERIFGALETPAAMQAFPPSRLPVCRHLAPAFETAEQADAPVARLSRALRAIEPKLAWRVRNTAAQIGEPYLSGHANAGIVAPDALESRTDVWVGVSLMAPNITYPYHDHPPEEVYVSLSPGDWQQNADPWVTPGIGGLIYNPPGIRHAMRAANAPFLAAWCLWVG
ncbi:MAG: dimethylsulfonioproprionate lyase family protein [Hyphomicrobiaceae bacterium]